MTDYAIIGDGATGTTAAFYIRRHDPEGRIRIYSDEPTPAYYRAALTNYLMGELRADQLFAVPPNFYQEFRVERVLTRVNGIDSANRRLYLSNGSQPTYDKLLIGSGSHARMPSFPGTELGGVMVLRTMQDARYVMDSIQSGRLKRAVIVGGGILGLEWVAGLRSRKVDVTYVVRENGFMRQLLDQAASDLVISRLRHFGVDLRTQEELGEIYGGPDLQAIRLKNSGEIVEAQILGFAIGIVPNIEFLEGSGIATNRGIPVDKAMRTNVADVFAGGDVAEVIDPVTGKTRGLGLWEPARHHGRVAGINMAGGRDDWRLDVQYNATRLYDLDLAAVGETLEKPTDEVVVEFPETGASISYRKLVFRNDELVGALLLGQRKERVRQRGRMLRNLIAMGANCSGMRDELLDPFFDISLWMESLSAKAETADAGVRMNVSRIMDRPVLGHEVPSRPDLMRSVAATEFDRRPERVAANSRSLSRLMNVVDSPVPAAVASGGSVRGGQSVVGSSQQIEGGSVSAVLRLEDGRIHNLAERVTIGRNPDNDLVIGDPMVSGAHAEIRKQHESFVISDLDSSNGVYIDDQRIKTPQSLLDGQEIRLGETRLSFSQQALPPRAETGPAGLPDEPIRSTEGTELYGRIEWAGGTFDIVAREMQIGRDPQESEITLDDPAVSWLHAEISFHDGGCYLRDLGSRNGSYVNAELVTVPHLLREGDVIHVGNTDIVFRAMGRVQAPAPAEPEPSMNGSGSSEASEARIVAQSGPNLGLSFELKGRRVTVGRELDTDIALKDLTVSRHHAVFEGAGADWSVRDNGSTNGTFVNGERLEPNKNVALKDGDEVKIGDSAFSFKIPTGSPRGETQLASPPPRQGTVVASPPTRGQISAAEGPRGSTTIAEPPHPPARRGETSIAPPPAPQPDEAAIAAAEAARREEEERKRREDEERARAAAEAARREEEERKRREDEERARAAAEAARREEEETAALKAEELARTEAEAKAAEEPIVPAAPVRGGTVVAGFPSQQEATRLAVKAGPLEGESISLDALPLILGREGGGGVQGLKDQFVSGQHLEISRDPAGSLFAKDLGSTNGSRLNDEQMEANRLEPLHIGDQLRLGPRTLLEVE